MTKINLEQQIQNANEEVPFKDKTELGEAFDSLDSVKEDNKGRSAIDLNTRLTPDEIQAIKVVDELKHLGILPEECDITTATKRLAISRDGLGRKEKIQMTQGIKEQHSSGGFLGKMLGRRE